MATWKLPIETLQGIWHAGYPSLIGSALTQGKPDPSDLRDVTVLQNLLVAQQGDDNSDAGPVPPHLQLKGPIRITAWDRLKTTFLIHPYGLTLPLWTKIPETGALDGIEHEQDGALIDQNGPLGLSAHLRAQFGDQLAAPNWVLRGSQIDLIRAAASVARVRLWSSLDYSRKYGPGRNNFLRLVDDAYRDAQPRHALPSQNTGFRLNAVGFKKGENDKLFLNFEDGAGYFTEGGYTLRLPLAPVAHYFFTQHVKPSVGFRTSVGFNPCTLVLPDPHDEGSNWTCDLASGAEGGLHVRGAFEWDVEPGP